MPNWAVDATMPSTGASSAKRRADFVGFLPIDPNYYDLEREIARGGMGRIRIARDRRLGRAVAVKEMLVTAGEAAIRFEREARITARLQHPSIVNIHEAGTWPSGEPFYAMKLVSGRSLDEVVAEAKTFEERLALLPTCLAIADAMAYAHGERVIHRDLKPKNVLVGAFGETVVIDWGLAKDLADDAASILPQASAPYRAGGNDLETEVGEVMGTPAYMPPEQAEGEAVDERADVYSLGALMYHVLSGGPPYTGANGIAVLEAVKKAPPPPLVKREPKVPPDLLAIVDRAMQREPGARYPSARELADDLRRYQTGQLVGAHQYSLRDLLRRWVRRHRAALSVAAIATIVLLSLGGIALQRIIRAQRLAEEQRVLADGQRTIAEGSRGESEKLLSLIIDDLYKKLQPLGKLDLLDAVVKQAAAHYDRVGENLSDPELATRARARRGLGDVKASQGERQAAVAEYRAALAIDEMLLARSPSEDARKLNFSISNQKLGDGLIEQGDTTGALSLFEVALPIRKELVAKDPDNVQRQQDLASLLCEIADVRGMRADAQGALEAYQECHAVTASIAAKDPTNPDRQRNLGITQTKIGDARLSKGDVAGALREYREGLAIRTTLADKDPKDAGRQEYVARGHFKLGTALKAAGDTTGAIAEFRAGLGIHEALSANDPTNASTKWSVALDRAELGRLLKVSGDLAGALSEHQRALATSEALLAKDPSSDDFRFAASSNHFSIGEVMRAQGRLENALIEYRKALAVADASASRDVVTVAWQQQLLVTHERIGDVLLSQKDVEGALAEFRKQLEIGQALAAKDVANQSAQIGPAYGHEKIGEALIAKRDFTGALASLRTGLAIRERAAATGPNLQWELGMAQQRVGDVLLSQGNKAEALKSFQAGLEIAERLVAQNPNNPDWGKLASTLRAQLSTCCSDRR
jgi:serine/threonine protein kinase/predicted negative regulator of RcsB-dependent stress response